MKEYLIKSIVAAVVFIGLFVLFDAIFNEIGILWKYVIAGVLFGFGYEGFWRLYKQWGSRKRPSDN